jgi:hypothetical protein
VWVRGISRLGQPRRSDVPKLGPFGRLPRGYGSLLFPWFVDGGNYELNSYLEVYWVDGAP